MELRFKVIPKIYTCDSKIELERKIRNNYTLCVCFSSLYGIGLDDARKEGYFRVYTAQKHRKSAKTNKSGRTFWVAHVYDFPKKLLEGMRIQVKQTKNTFEIIKR